MAATTNSKIPLKKQLDTAGCCSICGKKLKFDRRSENSLACWKCMTGSNERNQGNDNNNRGRGRSKGNNGNDYEDYD